MKLTINGIKQEEKEGITVKELLQNLGLNTAQVAVELNKEIVKKTEYSGTVLKDGDMIEIVHFVGGG